MIRFLSSVLTLLALCFIACQSPAPQSATPEAAGQTSQEDSPESSPNGEADTIQYEPAFPSDVSSEELTEDDVAQQETTHSHGGEEHSHEDDIHSHDDDGHSEDDSHGEHEH